MWRYGEVPSAIAKAFEDKATISAPELCRLLPLDPKTLKRHCREGQITYVQTGFGPRRSFTLEAIMRFLTERSVTKAPSAGLPKLRIASSQSGWAGEGIAALYERRKREKQQQREAANAVYQAARDRRLLAEKQQRQTEREAARAQKVAEKQAPKAPPRRPAAVVVPPPLETPAPKTQAATKRRLAAERQQRVSERAELRSGVGGAR